MKILLIICLVLPQLTLADNTIPVWLGDEPEYITVEHVIELNGKEVIIYITREKKI